MVGLSIIITGWRITAEVRDSLRSKTPAVKALAKLRFLLIDLMEVWHFLHGCVVVLVPLNVSHDMQVHAYFALMATPCWVHWLCLVDYYSLL